MAARPPATGYLVEEVFPRNQGLTAGLQAGDIIMVYNGQNVESEDIRPLQNSIPEGQKGELQVHRAGQLVRLYVNRGMLGIDGRFVRKR
jgi:S1-C subfamily serine protease